jgi:serine/threonine protein kinase
MDWEHLPSFQKVDPSGLISIVCPNDEVKEISLQKEFFRPPKHGTFGCVLFRQETDHKIPYAIKIFPICSKNQIREIDILKSISHPNIIQMIGYFFEKYQEMQFGIIIMDYFPVDLRDFIQDSCYLQCKIPTETIVKVLSGIASALSYLHAQDICHRDIKPDNILIDLTSLTGKICDLGSAKKLKFGEPNEDYICTRYYRAPELLCGKDVYDYSIDIWSFGCILAEMLILRPFFQGVSSSDQMVKIISIIGFPTQKELEFLQLRIPRHYILSSETVESRIGRYHECAPHELTELCQKIFHYDAKDRITAQEIVSYFETL